MNNEHRAVWKSFQLIPVTFSNYLMKGTSVLPFKSLGLTIIFQQCIQETGNKWQNKMAYSARSYILNKKRWEFQLLTQYHMQVKQLLFYFNFKARTGRQSKMPKMFASGSLDVRVQQ